MQIANGVQVEYIKEKKFKDVIVSIRFLNTFTKQDATLRSVLSLMLNDRSEKHPTKQALSNKLDELYGASLSLRCVSLGEGHVIELSSKFINPMYAKEGKKLFQDDIALLKELLFHPLMSGELLSKETFDEAKKILKGKLSRRQEEPSQAVIIGLMDSVASDAPISLSAPGDLETLENITLEEVNKAYQEMLANDQIDILVGGDLDEAMVYETISSIFTFQDRSIQPKTFYAFESDAKEKYEEVYRDITQSYIGVFYDTKTTVDSNDFWALRLVNAIFGQYPTSYLFQEVREKRSLCYSVFSSIIAYDGALIVSTGVEKKNVKEAIDLIKLQFERIKKGDIEDELIEVSKKMIANSLHNTKDDMQSILALFYQNKLLSRNMSSDDMIHEIEKVSKDDIIRVANKCACKGTYILTSRGEEDGKN